jgi:hypothetical protein
MRQRFSFTIGWPALRRTQMCWTFAKAIVKFVDMPFGTRPFRVHIDPAQDGAEIVNGVAEHVRTGMLRNMGLADLLRPSSTKIPAQKAS